MKFSRPLVIALLALLGLAVSIYLLTVHLGLWSAVCLGVGDCEAVNTSRFSEFLGLPVALWGIGAYLTLFALSVAIMRNIFAEWARRGLFAVAAIGVAFSAYLTYIELYVLYEVCPWCVLSAIIVTLIAVLSALELRDAALYEPETSA
ncbi:MAG: vitamin K epoxide reductase family protein [Chloroflexi bacterium]|nr:vitamin K epoxide reductase family protein [Chloroflexota bacterium]